MSKDFSFDVESDFDQMELTNALDQTKREILTRYDFKGTDSIIDLAEDKKSLMVEADSDYKIDAILDILESKLLKRGLSLKILDKTAPKEYASGDRVRQKVELKRGLDQEKAKKVSKIIRDSFPQIKPAIQGESLRVTGASKDDLQSVMSLLNADDSIEFPLQFKNFR